MKQIHLDWKNITLETKDGRLLQKYSLVFQDGLGTIRDFQAKLWVKEDAAPVFHRPWPVPFSLKSRIDEELERLVEVGVLEKIKLSDWASPIVPVAKKNDRMRICGNYKVSVNRALLVDQQYPKNYLLH